MGLATTQPESAADDTDDLPTHSLELGDLTKREGYLEHRRRVWQREAHKEHDRAEAAEAALTTERELIARLREGLKDIASRSNAHLARALVSSGVEAGRGEP